MKSEFREYYWLSLKANIIVMLAVISFFFYMAKDEMGNFNVRHVSFWLGCLLIIILIGGLYQKAKHDVKTIEITSKKIIFRYLITGKTEKITYKDIDYIVTVRKKNNRVNSQTFTYYVTEIHLLNNTYIEITHGDYKNTKEVLTELKKHYKEHQKLFSS